MKTPRLLLTLAILLYSLSGIAQTIDIHHPRDGETVNPAFTLSARIDDLPLGDDYRLFVEIRDNNDPNSELYVIDQNFMNLQKRSINILERIPAFIDSFIDDEFRREYLIRMYIASFTNFDVRERAIVVASVRRKR